jgi:hypothetical protein
MRILTGNSFFIIYIVFKPTLVDRHNFAKAYERIMLKELGNLAL